MPEITLPKDVWYYNDQDPLGPPGGFGAVFRGQDVRGDPVAIKRLLSAYDTREMRIADFLLGHGLAHVIPILDAGFDMASGTNFIVMPIATMSLQQKIDPLAPLGVIEVLEILDAIASGLEEIGDIIHRDLKPGNVLLHNGIWKLADLGLARFAEAATSMHTMREALTPSYAAPEQWRSERPGKATDVYALGCIVYALLQGAPPFVGPEMAQFSHQHQFDVPPKLQAPSHIRRLASGCLAKSPLLRPAVGDLRKQIQSAKIAAERGRARELADISAEVGEQALVEEQRQLDQEYRVKARKQLASEAIGVIEGIFDELDSAILQDAANAKSSRCSTDSRLKEWSLGDGSLRYGVVFGYDALMVDNGATFYKDNVPHAGRRVGSEDWDVLAGAYISVQERYIGGRGRSANLWFGQLLEGDSFRWWEVSYVYRGEADNLEPEPYGMLRYISGYNFVSEEPLPITPEYIDEFLDRWLGRFAVVAKRDSPVMAALFPKRFQRQAIPSKFRVKAP